MKEQKNSKSGIIFWNIMLFLNTMAATSYITEDIKYPETDTTLMAILLGFNTILSFYMAEKSGQKYNQAKKLQNQR